MQEDGNAARRGVRPLLLSVSSPANTHARTSLHLEIRPRASRRRRHTRRGTASGIRAAARAGCCSPSRQPCYHPLPDAMATSRSAHGAATLRLMLGRAGCARLLVHGSGAHVCPADVTPGRSCRRPAAFVRVWSPASPVRPSDTRALDGAHGRCRSQEPASTPVRFVRQTVPRIGVCSNDGQRALCGTTGLRRGAARRRRSTAGDRHGRAARPRGQATTTASPWPTIGARRADRACGRQAGR